MLQKSKIIDNLKRSEDSRGSIISIVDSNIKNVSIIHCNPGSIRSNHYHLTDSHYMYVLKGEIDYFYKSLNSEEINYFKVEKYQNIFTPPLEIHATYFPIETTLLVSSANPRDKETYEKDTIRVDFVDSKNISDLLNALKK